MDSKVYYTPSPFGHSHGCQCGADDFPRMRSEYDDEPRCRQCDTGPLVEGRVHKSVQRARKSYGSGLGEIRPGDLYLRRVHFAYYPDGPCTLAVTRIRIEKGSAWGAEAGERNLVVKERKLDTATYRWENIYY